jgi:hypothetical protein
MSRFPARAPLWEAAALRPAGVFPPLNTTTGFFRATSAATSRKFARPLMLSR